MSGNLTQTVRALEARVKRAYRGTAIQTDGAWKFSEVSARFKHMSNLDQGWVRQPFRSTEIGAER